jgi:hypothetical protein
MPEKIKKEDIPKLIEQMVKETPDGGIDREILRLALEPKQQEDPLIYMMRVNMIQQMLERTKKGEELDMNKILTFMAIKTAMQPQPSSIDPNLLLALTKAPSSDSSGQWSQFMQAYLQQQAQMQQQQAQFNQQLMSMLFGQRIQQTEQTVQALQQSLSDYLQDLNQKILDLQARITQPGASPDLVQQLEYEMKKKEVLEKFAETFKPKEIVGEGGKINWGQLLDRAMGIGEKIVEKMPPRMPELKPVQPIPVMPAQPTPQPVEVQPQTPAELPTPSEEITELPTIENIPIEETKE